MKTEIVAVTAPRIHGTDGNLLTADQFLVYTARVSNPSNQLNTATGPRLLAHCLKHGHWSVFQQASMTIEIETSLAIAMQIIRHSSFSFQMFSQRYAEVGKLGDMLEPVELRGKAQGGNRQGSGLPVRPELQAQFESKMAEAVQYYDFLLSCGVAPESARFALPQCTKTRLYMTGSVRSWIHYLHSRLDAHAQKEHRLVAESVTPQFAKEFPDTYNACITTEIPAHYLLPGFSGASDDAQKLLQSSLRTKTLPSAFFSFDELWEFCNHEIKLVYRGMTFTETDYTRANVMVAQLWLASGAGCIALNTEGYVCVLRTTEPPNGTLLLNGDAKTRELINSSHELFGEDLLKATGTTIQKV